MNTPATSMTMERAVLPAGLSLLLSLLKSVAALLALATLAVGATAKQHSWTLSTEDTRISIAVSNQQPVIQHLQTPHSKHDWVTTSTPVPLLSKVWLDGREVATAWSFVHAARNRSAGTLMLTFTNHAPRLSLRSVWRARPGHGPVEHWIEIVNCSGQRLAVSHQDSLALAGLHPGGRAKVRWIKRGASNATTQGGTFTEALTPRLKLNLVSNCEDGASPVPWLAVQEGESHGLYAG
jgi:hypothetical protein